MKNHVITVAMIELIFGILVLSGVILVWILFGFGFNILESMLPVSDIPEVALSLLHFIIGFAFAVAASVSLLSIIAGIGLLSFQGWARILTIVVSAFRCLNVPFGTLIGVYSIWVLAQAETKLLFRR